MKYYQLTAYILSRKNVGEADRIITLYSQEHGLKRVVAKGVRKGKAKLAGHLEPFTLVSLRLTKGKSLDIVIGAQAEQTVNLSQLSTHTMATLFYMVEIVARLTAEDHANSDVFELLEECISALILNTHTDLIRQYFCLRFLQCIGSQPDLSDTDILSRHYLAYSSGKIVTTRPQEHYGGIDVGTIKLWRILSTHSLDQVMRLTNISDALKQSEMLLHHYYEYHFHFVPKSTKVFQDT